MKKFFKKIKWRNVITVALVVAAVAGCIGGAIALFGNRTKEIKPGEFVRGDIDATTGKFIESTVAIYTEDSFACDGMKIVPDFQADCSYQIYYYDAKDEFVGVSEVMTGAYEGVNPEADRARVVIRPNAPEDLEDDEEFKIRSWQVRKYAKQLTITVNRDQVEYRTISVDLMNGKTLSGGAFTVANLDRLDADGTTVKSTPLYMLDNVKYDYYRVYVKIAELSDTNVIVAFGDADKGDGTSVTAYPAVDGEFAYVLDGSSMSIGTWYSITVKTPKGADAFRVMGPATAEYRIYGMSE